MKKQIYLLSGSIVIFSIALTSCFKEDFGTESSISGSSKIQLYSEISQIYQTRANDDGFCDGDEVGIYVVDYNGSIAGTLQDKGNRADNVKHTFDEAKYKWNASKDVYWKDDKTNIDIFGYYPYGSPQSAKKYTFEVKKDQSISAAYGNIGGYEASDFLWGKAENVAPTDKVIKLGFGHKMASIRVSLAEGTGFAIGEWTSIDKAVLILNTKRNANIDLSTGIVTATGDIPSTSTIPMKDNGNYRAIVVPQTLNASIPLVSVTIGGTPYLLTKTEVFAYVASKQHNFTITVNKRNMSGFEFVLTSESITAWENDNSSHDAAAREYIVINVPEAGTLAQCIAVAGKDIAKVKNMKLTGSINSRDFAIIRYKMPLLQSLNLKEINIVKGTAGSVDETNWYNENNDLEIPENAFYQKSSLVRIVLPDKLNHIGRFAFFQCSNIVGSLIIPEGVTHINEFAFDMCKSLTGYLSLPTTLDSIGMSAFGNCTFNSELKLPESLKYIGKSAFMGNGGLYGSLILPENLEYIGDGAFAGCSNLTGSLEIPGKIIEIPSSVFSGCGFDGTLKMHDEILFIDDYAFAHTRFRGELKLPKELITIKEGVFNGCDFSGELKIPENVEVIGPYAFSGNIRLIGMLEIPRNVLSIGNGAFNNCSSIEGVMFNEALESIGQSAFNNCTGLGKIISKSAIPPQIIKGAFDAVPKDNFTVEVPESAVSLYQTAIGWNDFKRISAYRELSVSPNTATAINTCVTRDIILRAESDWTMESKPDWVTINKTSGAGMAEIKVTFQEMAKGSSNREGEIVFKLVSKDYRTKFKVTQYNYEYAEDQFITIQSATKGKGVNIVFLGDGYSAKDISESNYNTKINEAVGHFFNVEPYKSYKEYFNVYFGIAISPESGIGGVNSLVTNKFNTYALGGVLLGPLNRKEDIENIFKYALKAPTVSEENIDETLIIMIVNTSDYGGTTYLYNDGSTIAYCPVSNYGYPFDFRGLIQHEAGGHGFGKLGDEYIVHNAFIQYCGCGCHPHISELMAAKNLGWCENISLSGKLNEVTWSHFIFNEKYNQVVDVFEGGFYHTKGVYRSEQSSCMNNNIPYFNAISREAIVKRIKKIAGEAYSFQEFLAKDVLDASAVTKTGKFPLTIVKAPVHSIAPVMMGKRPKLNVIK